MIIIILISALSGVACGIITGLTPGIHINLVSATLLSLSSLLLGITSPIVLCVFIISMSVTHSFLDSIPSIFLGAPESDTALGVLPGHRYLLKGQGLLAVKLTLIGSFGALILSVLMYLPLYPFVGFIYPLIKDYVGYILVVIAGFVVFRDRKRHWAFFVFMLSGILGYIVLSFPNLGNPLFPLLSGLFGVSTLIYSIKGKNNVPKQKISKRTEIDKRLTLKALFSGQFSGFLTAVLPGVGAATAALLSLQITRKLGDAGFMILMGSINTVNFTLSILTFHVLDKARNGSIVAVSKLFPDIGTYEVIVFLSTALIAGGLAAILTLRLGRLFSIMITRVNYRLVVSVVIASIFALSVVLSGLMGLMILIISTAVGLIPAIKKVARINAMGCLMLPVIIFFML